MSRIKLTIEHTSHTSGDLPKRVPLKHETSLVVSEAFGTFNNEELQQVMHCGVSFSPDTQKFRIGSGKMPNRIAALWKELTKDQAELRSKLHLRVSVSGKEKYEIEGRRFKSEVRQGAGAIERRVG